MVLSVAGKQTKKRTKVDSNNKKNVIAENLLSEPGSIHDCQIKFKIIKQPDSHDFVIICKTIMELENAASRRNI